MAVLNFKDVAALQRIVEHICAADEHSQGYGEEGQGPAVGSLVLVKDRGIYIMSNGQPADRLDPADDKSSCFVAYADGYDPTKGDVYDKCRDAVGGDDFAEFLPLEANTIKAIREGCELKINVTATSILLTARRPRAQKSGAK